MSRFIRQNLRQLFGRKDQGVFLGHFNLVICVFAYLIFFIDYRIPDNEDLDTHPAGMLNGLTGSNLFCESLHP